MLTVVSCNARFQKDTSETFTKYVRSLHKLFMVTQWRRWGIYSGNTTNAINSYIVALLRCMYWNFTIFLLI